MRIKVTKCSYPGFWYENAIGKTFPVHSVPGARHHYWIVGDDDSDGYSHFVGGIDMLDAKMIFAAGDQNTEASMTTTELTEYGVAVQHAYERLQYRMEVMFGVVLARSTPIHTIKCEDRIILFCQDVYEDGEHSVNIVEPDGFVAVEIVNHQIKVHSTITVNKPELVIIVTDEGYTFDGMQYKDKIEARLAVQVENIRAEMANRAVLDAGLNLEEILNVKDVTPYTEASTDAIPPSKRMWRSLVRVDSFNIEEGWVKVIVPSWDYQQLITMFTSVLPETVLFHIQQGQERFHAMVNIGAATANELKFRNWEVE